MPFVGIGVTIGGQTLTSEAFTGLLDTYSGAAAAYSLRLLSSTYSGDSIRVRRASDNAESDIGFVSGQLDTSTLETFCSGTDGFVTTWYDQSGNGYDATQSTSANQPKIVSSGSIVTKSGFSCVDFNGSTAEFDLPNATNIDNVSTFLTFAADSNAQDCTILHYNIDFNNIVAIGLGDLGTNARIGHRYVYTGTIYTSGEDFNTTEISQASTISTGGTATQLYLDGTAGTQTYASRSGGTIASLGSRGNIQFFNGKVLECVIYNSDQSSNRTGIESNINTHYNIY